MTQVKQLLYGPARRQRLGAAADATPAAMEQEQESALLSELAEGDFSADQNIVEVAVLRNVRYYGPLLRSVRYSLSVQTFGTATGSSLEAGWLACTRQFS